MKTIGILFIGGLLGMLCLPYVLMRQPEMPAGTHLRSEALPYSHAELLIDRTVWDSEAESPVLMHTIFKTILDEIDAATDYLIVDFFLWNPWKGAIESEVAMPQLSQQLADALIEKRRLNPDLPILVITDPINRIYSHHAPEFYDRMAAVGIPVVFTDLTQLPDSNRIYAPQARFWGQFIDLETEPESEGSLPNPFEANGPKLSLGAYAKLLYFKANHRKVVISGRPDGRSRLVLGSLNPADGSGFHSNMGVLVEGPVAQFAADSELSIAEWSAQNPEQVHALPVSAVTRVIDLIRRQLAVAPQVDATNNEGPTVTWVSEGEVRRALVEVIDSAGAGAQVDCGIFYFSERSVVDAMKAAIRRGVELRILMDPNRDAFGREKGGIPNREVAAELMELSSEGSVQVRWAATNGEQFHTKALRLRSAEEDLLLLGSANWTRRNLGNLNLEANLIFHLAGSMGQAFDEYFDKVWHNQTAYTESHDYETWAESGWSLRWKTWLYRFQEWSGASTF